MPVSGPVGAREFAALLSPLGPFGARPRVAVAVSGGADSMALLALASAWAAAAPARLAALTVDHGLRAGSAGEAAWVAGRCARRRVDHHILEWRGPKPRSGVQQAARAARYDLLTGWCRDNGFAHLMVGHNAGDQAETLLMRMRRGSGVDGLAAMPAAAVRDGVRVLRPLLRVGRGRLAATLRAAGEGWVEDPGNRDRAFERVRVRDAAARLRDGGVARGDVARAAAELGALRARREREVAALAARAAAVLPEGYAEVDGEALGAAEPGARLALLSALLRTVGGAPHGPRARRLARLASELASAAPARRRTLGGCLVEPRGGRLRICREPAAVRDRRPAGGRIRRWDGRFEVSVAAPGRDARVAPLGEEGWRAVAGEARRRLPGPVCRALPALWEGGTVVEVPFGVYARGGAAAAMEVRFRPPAPLCGPPFRLA